MTKALFVIAPENFKDVEYLAPQEILKQGGVETKVASLKEGKARGANGTEVAVDFLVNDVNPTDYDAIIFVGGPGMAEIVTDERLKKLAKDFFAAKKLTTAICIAPMILVNAGLLKGKQATVWAGATADFKAQGAIYQGEGVFIDGLFITASGPQVAKEFGEKILKMLARQEK